MPKRSFPFLRQAACLLLAAALLAACRGSAAPGPQPTPGARQPAAATLTVTSRPTITATVTAPAAAAMEETPSATATTPTSLPETAASPPGRMMAPILLYHHVSDHGSGRYYIPVAAFHEQMQYLHDQGYTSISISQLASAIRGETALPEKPVAITFDDGYLDIYANALPVMKEYGFTGVAYVITGTLEEGKTYGYMQESELKALLAAGWEIGSHSVTHDDLTKSKLGIGNEMKQSKAALEKLFGVPILSFAYPFGIANPWIEDRAAEFGYTSAVGINILDFHTSKQLFFLSRREVYRSLTMVGFRELLTPSALELASQPASSTPTPASP